MGNATGTLELHKESFIANLYTVTHFRMIGLIDVRISYPYGVEKVTLAFYSSSGTNNGKIKGLWYPIVGIKTRTGSFTEFSSYLNSVLTQTTSHGAAKRGWLAKSLFFYETLTDSTKTRGFSNGKYYAELLNIGQTLRYLYEEGEFKNASYLNPHTLNDALYSSAIYPGNTHTQQSNFDNFVRDLFLNPL